MSTFCQRLYHRKCQRRWSKNLQSFQRSLNYQSQNSSRPSWHCSLSVNQNYLFKKVVKMQVLVIGAKVISLPRSALLNCENTEPLNTADRIQVQLEGSEQPSRKPLSPPTLFGCKAPAKAKQWSDFLKNRPEISLLFSFCYCQSSLRGAVVDGLTHSLNSG